MVLNEERDTLIPAHLIHEQAPEDLSSALEKAMSLNTNLRPQSAVEMRSLLSDKQKAVVSTKPNTAENAAGVNLRTQNTKVLDYNERLVSDSKQSDIKTEVLPARFIADDSVKTNIAKDVALSDKNGNTQSAGVANTSSPNRKPLVAAAAIGAFLLVGGVFSAVYFLSPEESGSGVLAGNTSSTVNHSSANSYPLEMTDSNANLDDSNSIMADSNMNSDDSNLSMEATTDLSDPKMDESPKTVSIPKEPTKPGKTSKASSKSIEEMIKTAELTIEKRKINTDGVVINDKGVIVKATPPKSGKPPITKEELKALSPEQRRKVFDSLDKHQRKELRKRIERQRLKRTRRKPPRPRKP